MITAGRIGQAEVVIMPSTLNERVMTTVVALDDEADGQVTVRVAGVMGHIDIVTADAVTWTDPPPLKESYRERWWLTPISAHGPFLPFDSVFKVATMAERDGIALDVAYISSSGEPVDAEQIEVLDLGYASGALLAQAADMKRPVQVARALEELLALGPAINAEAYDRELNPQRVLIAIPMHQVLSVRLRMPTSEELAECRCVYGSDDSDRRIKCQHCRQQEAAADLVAVQA